MIRSAFRPDPSDPTTWLQAASQRRIAVASIAGAIAGLAIVGLGTMWMLSASPGDTFFWWIVAWGSVAVLAALGVQLRIEIARPIAGILLGLAALLALAADMLAGFALDSQDIAFTVLAAIVALFGAVSFVGLGLIGYAVGLALDAFFNR